MSATGFAISFADKNGVPIQANLPLESLGVLEGGLVTGNGIQVNPGTHGPSEVIIKIPDLDPATIPQIPFAGEVTLAYKGKNLFVGRRVDLDGEATPTGKGYTYQLLDAWWDLSKITFKQVWWNGSYQAITTSGNTITFPVPQIFAGVLPQANFYDANKNRIGSQWNITPGPDSPTSTATATGGQGTLAGAKFISFYSYYTDTILFQYSPSDPYYSPAQILQYYITTGEQIQAILAFAIAQGVNLQIGQIDPALFVPWYPIRCANCADAIKICLRMHPDCFTEIDYTTTPPTFNVRQRANLTAVLLPYAFTDANGRQHVATNIKPRQDLIPSRIAIFYRYLVNGQTVAFPSDVWPMNAPDGLLALDYSIDLQGPRVATSNAEITSISFDPSNSPAGMAWWKKKCAALAAPEVGALTMVDANGIPGSAGVMVVDDNGNVIDYLDTYKWEFIAGTQSFWMTGINVVTARVSTYFNYSKNSTAGTLLQGITKHAQTTRVKLVNTASVSETFTQYLTTGQAIPPNLAQSIFNSLAALQYNLTHKIKEEPFSGAFIKPGKHCVNLTGGQAAWQTMRATVQSSSYTLFADANGNTFAEATIKCGPVAHLEAGQLVQLFNLFTNRDISKIDPWERITGLASPNSQQQAIDNTPQENSHPGLPENIFTTHIAPAADVNGNFTVVSTDSRTSGLKLFKWDGETLNPDGSPAPAAGQPFLSIDLGDILAADIPNIGEVQLRNFGAGSTPLYLLASGKGSLGGGAMTFKITQIGLGDYFIARTWDGTTLGTVDYTIAKTLQFRESYLAETTDGVAITHAFTDENTRTSTDSTGTQTEKCQPRFQVGLEITAKLSNNGSPVKDLSGNVVQWLDDTARDWLQTS